MIGLKTDIKILDKISSKNELINLTNGEELVYKDLAIIGKYLKKIARASVNYLI